MVTKAVIEIEIEPDNQVGVEQSAKKTSLTSNITASAKAAAEDTSSKSIQNFANQALKSASKTNKKQFTVKFNPNQLSLSAYGGGTVAKTDFTANNGSYEFEKIDFRINLTVPLIFDDETRTDAFMSDKMQITGLARSGISAIADRVYTVQPQVEGFIAALRQKNTRKIHFQWGTMSYYGVLDNVTSEYTMFSISGRPIRATVQLSILCVDKKVQDGNMGQWGNYYDKAFGSDSTNLETTGQVVGNLLNINL